MKLVYTARVYANEGKIAQLDKLLAEWQSVVNGFIETFWGFDRVVEANPPQEFKRGSRVVSAAARKAWAVVKGTQKAQKALKLRPTMPIYRSSTLEFDSGMATFDMSPETVAFDGWVNVRGIVPGARIAIPFKQYKKFRNWLASGKISKTVHLHRRSDGKWFVKFFVERQEHESRTDKRIGIDVGYTIAAATSTGERYGEELRDLQRRTKWRVYRSHDRKPYRQQLNRVAKQIVADNPCTDFAVEQLNFKGKRKRSKVFRTRLSRFAYQHLAQRLEHLGKLECFQVAFVDPAYTSQTCSKCGCVDSRNRCGEKFRCIKCSHEEHADTNAAINLNGGKAVVYYDRLATPSPLANATPEYPGTVLCPADATRCGNVC